MLELINTVVKIHGLLSHTLFLFMKFLIVDDFSTMRRIIKNLLRDIGYDNVVEAEDGKQALSIIKGGGIDFVITEEALEFIVDQAVEYKLGARGLRSLCEAILTDAMFELPGTDEKKLQVTREYAEQKLNKSTIKKLKAVS